MEALLKNVHIEVLAVVDIRILELTAAAFGIAFTTSRVILVVVIIK